MYQFRFVRLAREAVTVTVAVYEIEAGPNGVCIEWAAVGPACIVRRGRVVSDAATVAALVGRLSAAYTCALPIEAAAEAIPELAEALATWPHCIEAGPLRIRHRVHTAAEMIIPNIKKFVR